MHVLLKPKHTIPELNHGTPCYSYEHLINSVATCRMQDSNLKLERIGIGSKLLAQSFLKPCQWYFILWFWWINLHTSLGKKNVCIITAQCHKSTCIFPCSLKACLQTKELKFCVLFQCLDVLFYKTCKLDIQWTG